MTTFGFDVSLTRSTSKDDYFSLMDRGFTRCTTERDHPGAHKCRFILFENGAPLSSAVQVNRQYLEYVEITNQDEAQEYLASINANDAEYKSSVVYLSCGKGLESLYHQGQPLVEHLGPSFLHKNYNWQEDSKSVLPGWNFIFFKRNLVHNINCSFAEYEPSPTTRVSDIAFTRHPNTAYKILGTVWSAGDNELLDFKAFTGLQTDAGVIDLQDATKIWTVDARQVERQFFEKKTGVTAVIIACRDFNACIAHSKPDIITTFQGKPAAVIKQHHAAWDIVLTEG